MNMSQINPYDLARDIISRFDRNGAYSGFKYLMNARSGLESFESSRIDLACDEYGDHTEKLVEKLKDVFNSVYGKTPVIRVYLPRQDSLPSLQ
jgi:hypothetical protein